VLLLAHLPQMTMANIGLMEPADWQTITVTAINNDDRDCSSWTINDLLVTVQR